MRSTAPAPPASGRSWANPRRPRCTETRRTRWICRSIATRSSRRCPSRLAASGRARRCWHSWLALELGELVAVLAAQRVRLRAREAELLADLRDLGALLAADRAVGGRHRVEAREQVGALLAAREQAELARHEVVLRAAEVARLALRDLHDERGFGAGESRDLVHDPLHLGGFRGLDRQS